MRVPEFPPKKVMKWNSKVLEQRRLGLQSYVQVTLLYIYMLHKYFVNFFVAEPIYSYKGFIIYRCQMSLHLDHTIFSPSLPDTRRLPHKLLICTSSFISPLPAKPKGTIVLGSIRLSVTLKF